MQQDYIFWRDLFDTYQSLPPWLQLAWLIALAALVLAAGRGFGRIVALIIHQPKTTPQYHPPAHVEHGVPYLEHGGEAPRLTAPRLTARSGGDGGGGESGGESGGGGGGD
ncbi:MAG: hypothetical protein ABJH33_02090 [Rhizobiaceae bacterium]